MNRVEAAVYVGARLAALLSAAGRTANDSTGNLRPVIDDALRALGYTDADLDTGWSLGEPTVPDSRLADYRLQLVYRALVQIHLDLAAQFDISTRDGDSFRLSQAFAMTEKMLARYEKLVLERFGTLDAEPGDGESGLITMDLNFLASWHDEVLA